ncbi:MAG: hypothetical protein AAGA95_00560, partial [Pseudomonadota bacterium]
MDIQCCRGTKSPTPFQTNSRGDGPEGQGTRNTNAGTAGSPATPLLFNADDETDCALPAKLGWFGPDRVDAP